MPLFSVIIPLYNKENYIEATLKSVLAQTVVDFEVVIIDDVSTDASLAAVRRIEDSRIRIISHAKNKGLSASRNTGIRAAAGNYIAFLDADDLWEPQFLEAIKALIDTYPEAAVYATKYKELRRGGIVLEHRFSIGTGMVDNFFLSNLNQSIYNYSCLCIKKSAVDVVGFFDETINYAEDVDYNIRLHLVFRMAYDARPLAYYNIHSENQITRNATAGKTITDFAKYEKQHPENADLKKFVDFKRYIMAKHYRIEGDHESYMKMVGAIAPKSLNWKQRALLHMPAPVLSVIDIVKRWLLKFGFNPTSYS